MDDSAVSRLSSAIFLYDHLEDGHAASRQMIFMVQSAQNRLFKVGGRSSSDSGSDLTGDASADLMLL